MEGQHRLVSAAELAAPLEILPPVDFCCAYGSSLLSNNKDKTAMIDYILGVSDPLEWHAENLERNKHHYSLLAAQLGPRAITWNADVIGAGIHFNPFVEWKDKKIKYGVVRMQDLAWDVLTWETFYLSGRLQKHVCILADYWDIGKINLLNLKAATNFAVLLLPTSFSEEELYAKICHLSYMGDVRMLFAEDKNKVRNIVEGSFSSFRTMYKPFLEDLMNQGVLKMLPSCGRPRFEQEIDISVTKSLVSTFPLTIQRLMAKNQGVQLTETGAFAPDTIVSSREEAAYCCRKALRRVVRASSLRQAVSGFLATSGVNAVSYLARKMSKAWRSRAS